MSEKKSNIEDEKFMVSDCQLSDVASFTHSSFPSSQETFNYDHFSISRSSRAGIILSFTSFSITIFIIFFLLFCSRFEIYLFSAPCALVIVRTVYASSSMNRKVNNEIIDFFLAFCSLSEVWMKMG
jgi:hypothetical protein